MTKSFGENDSPYFIVDNLSPICTMCPITEVLNFVAQLKSDYDSKQVRFPLLLTIQDFGCTIFLHEGETEQLVHSLEYFFELILVVSQLDSGYTKQAHGQVLRDFEFQYLVGHHPV